MSGRRFCWDSCVFISLLSGCSRTPEELAGLRALAALVDDGEVEIFTPSITIIEVLACYLTTEQEQLFQALLNRSNIEVLSVSRKVSEKAREIRNHYQSTGLKIAVPDSIHLAMAIHYEAAALHTYDGCGKRKRKTDLLQLPRPIIGKYDLNVCIPSPPQTEPEEPKEHAMQAMSLFELMEGADPEE